MSLNSTMHSVPDHDDLFMLDHGNKDKDLSTMPIPAKKAKHRISVPLIGRVAAGSPIDSIEHFECMLDIDPDDFDCCPDYFLKVRGCSMINVGIMDGDLIGVHKVDPSTIHDGQIVVARVNHSDVTVKRYRRNGDQVLLIPENDQMSAIKVDLRKDSLEIDGVYVGLFQG